MEINEYEAGMLDAVLEAFAGRTELDWTQLLELFDGDEELAGAITQILAGEGLINTVGEETKNGLPEKITINQTAISFTENGGFTAQLNAPPPVEPVTTQREIVFEIENKLSGEEPVIEAEVPKAETAHAEPAVVAEEKNIPVKNTKPETKTEEPATDVLLNQEIAQLRFEQRRFDHNLRQKDIMIQNLTAQNETLGRFRIFIWVLLGLIALLIAGLIFRR